MYIVLDNNDRPIAFSDEYEIAEKYTENIYTSHHVKLKIRHMSSKKARQIIDLDDLYLVLYDGIYIQNGYVKYLDIAIGGVPDDLYTTKEVLIRLLVEKDLPKKTRKHIEKTVIALEKMISENKYTPTIEELQTMKMDYDPYFYSRGLI